MGTKFFRSTATCNCKAAAVVLGIVAVVAALLVHTGYAQEETPAVPRSPAEDDDPPPCKYMMIPLPHCIDWCKEQGFNGGGFINTFCCCGARLPPRSPPPKAAIN